MLAHVRSGAVAPPGDTLRHGTRRGGVDAGWEPLPGWHGRCFHSETMTFPLYDVDADAAPLHEHHHPEEEVWNVVSGELALVIDGVEHIVRAGQAAVVPPDTVHSARALGAVNPRTDTTTRCSSSARLCQVAGSVRATRTR